MDISEIVGFLITLAAIFLLFFRKRIDDKNSSEQSEDDLNDEELDREKSMNEFLKSIDLNVVHNSSEKKRYEDEVERFEEEDRRQYTPLPPRPPTPPKPKRPNPPIQQAPQTRQKLSPIKNGFEQLSHDSYKQKSHVEDRRTQTSIENSEIKSPFGENMGLAYSQDKKHSRPRVANILKKLHSKKEMIIISEIVGKPKGLM